jgi:CheY-like chemotaxis protein
MPKTLLLADDSVTIQRVIELTFAHEDVRVVSVSDGRRAVQWLEGEWPDVVLADVDVPELDGYELTRHIKNSPRLKDVPVLLLAGAFEPVDQERVRAIGCDGVLVKPFEPQQLVSRVKTLLARERTAVMAGAGVEEPPVEMAAVAAFPGLRVSNGGFEMAVGEPEPLEPPSRPVWEIGLGESVSTRATAPAASAASSMTGTPPKVSLVSAFSALLAAEQSSTSPVATGAPAAISDATVEDAVRRVLVRMTDDLVRRIVVETAERLIREEIEKIKDTPD